MTREPPDPARSQPHDPASRPAPLAKDASGDAVHLARRRFFRDFGREAFRSAANVAGAASALRRGTLAASSELLGLGIGDPAANARRLEEAGLAAAAETATGGFRAPYRLAGDTLFLLNQRGFPGVTEEIACRNIGDVVAAMRSFAVRGAPLLAQLAAYALALGARAAGSDQLYARNAILRGGATALRNARPATATIWWALARMLTRWERLGEEPAGDVLADALRAEADAIATEAMMDHARLGRHGAALLPQPSDRPLRVLLHGATGPLSAGMVGTAFAVVQAIASEGREVDVWLTEGGPDREGKTLGAWEFAQADISCTVVADAAAGWLMQREVVDAVLVGADWVAGNGDLVNLVGTFPIALSAARGGVPLYACTPLGAVDPLTADGGAIVAEERPADPLRGALPPGTDLRVPVCDVTPAELITAYVTDEGIVRPDYTASLAQAFEVSQARRPLAAT